MCEATKTKYLDKEMDIDFPCVIDELIELGLSGVHFLFSKVKQIIEMARIDNDLLDIMGNLKDIVWKVNMLFSSKREAVLACQTYSDMLSIAGSRRRMSLGYHAK